MRGLGWAVIAVVAMGCGGAGKDDLLGETGLSTGVGTSTGTETPGTLPDLGYAFIEVYWDMDAPAPDGIVHVLLFDAPFDDPDAVTSEPVGRGSSPLDAGAVRGDNMATYLFEDLPTEVTYGVLAFLDEDGTGGDDNPRPDSGDFVAKEGAGYPTLVFTVREGKVEAGVNTAVP